MPQTTALYVLIGVCAFFIIAKLFKVEKGALIVAVVVGLAWLELHFTGYDDTLYRIIFHAPSVQPEDYRYR
jgi:hypothetical protein